MPWAMTMPPLADAVRGDREVLHVTSVRDHRGSSGVFLPARRIEVTTGRRECWPFALRCRMHVQCVLTGLRPFRSS